jgi:hypothetical protein
VADILIDNQTAPTTPASGKSVLWNDSSTKSFVHTDDTGRHTGSLSRNDAVASLSISAADTYLTNSGLLVPSFGMKAGMLFRWFITATKTAAGTAAAIYTVRIGTGQAVTDTSRLALTATTAQTAAVSSGIILVVVHVRSVSASGVIVGGVGVTANNAGLGSGISGISSTFDNSALAGNYVGLSINNGTAGAWTIETVSAELIG